MNWNSIQTPRRRRRKRRGVRASDLPTKDDPSSIGVCDTVGPADHLLLAYQLMSFAGNRARGSVNQTYVEPQVSYNFESGWYVDCDPQMTFDWTVDAANGWTIPIGADVGEAFDVASHAMSVQFGAYDL